MMEINITEYKGFFVKTQIKIAKSAPINETVSTIVIFLVPYLKDKVNIDKQNNAPIPIPNTP